MNSKYHSKGANSIYEIRYSVHKHVQNTTHNSSILHGFQLLLYTIRAYIGMAILRSTYQTKNITIIIISHTNETTYTK